MIDLTELTLKHQITKIEPLIEQFNGIEDIVILANSHLVGSFALSRSAIKGIKCRVTPDGEGGLWKIVLIAHR
jgi:hypothetical protein